jgi:translation elongation factor EF-G
MAKHATQAIRAIALVGHGAAGKTTLTGSFVAQGGRDTRGRQRR